MIEHCLRTRLTLDNEEEALSAIASEFYRWRMTTAMGRKYLCA